MRLPLLGKTTCSLDSKRRLTLPSKVRELLGLTAKDPFLVVTVGYGGCLWLFTPKAWESFAPNVLKAVIQGNQKAIRLRDILAEYGTTIRADNNGRIMLTEAQMEYAGIRREVICFPSWTRAELWSPERYAAAHPPVTDRKEVDDLLGEFAGPLDESS